MKKIIPFISAAILIACNGAGNSAVGETDTLKDSEIFNGVYSGTTPCADCPGIKMQVNFSPDSMYYETSEYLDRATKFADTGRWEKSDSLLTVKFSGRDEQQRSFKIISDSTIRMLDGSGNVITGPLAEHYILIKSDSLSTR